MEMEIMEGCPEPLEKIFLQLEEESERRAEEERVEELLPTHTPVDSLIELSEKPTSKKNSPRRRASISISRLGQLTEADFASGPPTPNRLALASSSPFYQAQIANDSKSSIASGASDAHNEEDNHITQMLHIAPKHILPAKIMPRRLSRARSLGVLIPTKISDSNMVIGVSVQEATFESTPEEGESTVVAVSRRASVRAPGTLRHQASKSSLTPSHKLTTSWITKAKNFTLIFRRKNTNATA